MIYAVAFLISILFCRLGEEWAIGSKSSQNVVKWTGRIFLALAVTVLVVLAGCRDYTVGTDVLTYGNSIFYTAQRADSLGGLFRALMSHDVDPLYLIFNYAVAKFAKTPHGLYVVMGIEIYGGILLGILRYRKEYRFSITLAWTFYILLFFGTSFNLMRQMMALSVLFVGSPLILKHSYLRYIPYVVVASMLHQSALIIIVVIAMHWLIYHTGKFNYKILIIIALIALLLFYRQLLNLFINMGILSSRFTRYLGASEGFTFSINPLIQRIVPIIIFLIFSRKRWVDKRDKNFFLILMVSDVVLINMRGFLGTMSRVAIYFSVFSIVSYPLMLKKVDSGKNRVLLTLFLIIFFSGIWYYQYALQGGAEIYPYTSELLGIR